MKKLHVFLALVCMSAMMFAQTKNLRNADRALKNGKLDKAVESITLANQEPENQEIAEFWFSLGKIYTAVAANRNPEYANFDKTSAIYTAYDAFNKAFTQDQSGKIKNVFGRIELPKLTNAAYDVGTNFFNDKQFAEAAKAFEVCVNAGILLDQVDTNAIYNTALSANSAGDKPMAKKYYTKLVEINVDRPDAYIALANIFREENNKPEAEKYVDMAIKIFPDDYAAMINAASIHLMLENSDRAQQILSQMTEKHADNPLIFFALGVSYNQMKMTSEAEKAYLKAIELKADYFDAIFNLGVFYVDQGVQIKAVADELPIDETAKFDQMTAESNEIFKKAVPMLEKALEMKPNDVPVMSTLKDLYAHLRMMDKAQSMSAEIEKLNESK